MSSCRANPPIRRETDGTVTLQEKDEILPFPFPMTPTEYRRTYSFKGLKELHQML
jgi:hypothetical protein